MITFGVLHPGAQEMNWCSQRKAGGTLTNFNRNNEFDCVSEAGFIAYAVAVDPAVLHRLAARMGLSENFERLLREPLSWSSPGTLSLGEQLGSIFRAADNSGTALREHAESVDDEIPTAIFEEMTRSLPAATIPGPNTRKRILKKALDIVNDPDQIPITVAQLCARIGTSTSTLNRIFLAEYGVSPKSYIRFRCLSAVRDALACSPPGTKVSDLANQWGFWHMGQFAADYRSMFRELPSRTLQQS